MLILTYGVGPPWAKGWGGCGGCKYPSYKYQKKIQKKKIQKKILER